jgi:putative drug exporter of the RND superfamily
VAVFLDALVVRCVLLPAVLELLGPTTWRLPRRLEARLPHINIEGATARAQPVPHQMRAGLVARMDVDEAGAAD